MDGATIFDKVQLVLEFENLLNIRASNFFELNI